MPYLDHGGRPNFLLSTPILASVKSSDCGLQAMASPGAQAAPLGDSFSDLAISEKRSSAHLQCCLSSHGRAWYPTPIPDTCPFGGHESSWISQFGREAISNSKRRPCCLLWSLLWPPRPLRMDVHVIWRVLAKARTRILVDMSAPKFTREVSATNEPLGFFVNGKTYTSLNHLHFK